MSSSAAQKVETSELETVVPANCIPAEPDERGGRLHAGYELLFLVISIVPFYFRIAAPLHSDIELHYRIVTSIFHGAIPYKDETFEYPPYAILFFLPPLLGGNQEVFQILFALQILYFDVLIKTRLFGLRAAPRLRVVSFAAFAISTWFLSYFYLQRLDVIPSALSFLSAVFLISGNPFTSGVVLSLAIGTKAFPVLILPTLLVVAWVRNRHLHFIYGAVVGIAPLLLSSIFWPWWRFAFFHAGRGLQVESLYASIIWWLHRVAGLPATWTAASAWLEVHGAAADAVLPWAKAGFFTGSLFGLLASWRLALRHSHCDLARTSQICLVALLPFVAFNFVLSPQYLIWLLPFAAVALWVRPRFPPVAILISAWITPLFYPSPQYASGLELRETSVLVLRNLLLIAAWLSLLGYFFAAGIRNCLRFSKRYTMFCIVGGSGVIVDMAVLWVLVSPALLGWNLSLGKIIAAEIAIVNNFFWNDLWTFRGLTLERSWRAHMLRFAKFNVICAAGIFASVLLLNVQVWWLGLNIYLANFASIILVSLWNFWMNLRFGWKQPPSPAPSNPPEQSI